MPTRQREGKEARRGPFAFLLRLLSSQILPQRLAGSTRAAVLKKINVACLNGVYALVTDGY